MLMVFKPTSFKVMPSAPKSSSSLTTVDLNTLNMAVEQSVQMYRNELIQCGLNLEDVSKTTINQINSSDIYSANGILTLGQSSAVKINGYSDEMLQHVRTNDLENMGSNLNEVIGIAKNVKIDTLIGEDNFFAKVISKIRNTKEKILAQFNSVSTQLDRLVKEIDTQQLKLKERSNQLDVVFTHNINEYKELSLSIVFGEVKKNLIGQKISELTTSSNNDPSPFIAQKISDIQDIFNRVEKRIHDLKTLQLLALQTAPMIRMVQSNNISLIEKFDNIKMLTIPAWKKQFTLAITMLEQKKSIKLATKIDDATNDLIRKNADLLRQNTLQVAQSNQRSIIDIETLEHVQSTLISTLQDVASIEEEGKRNRKLADQKMSSMKEELSNIL